MYIFDIHYTHAIFTVWTNVLCVYLCTVNRYTILFTYGTPQCVNVCCTMYSLCGYIYSSFLYPQCIHCLNIYIVHISVHSECVHNLFYTWYTTLREYRLHNIFTVWICILDTPYIHHICTIFTVWIYILCIYLCTVNRYTIYLAYGTRHCVNICCTIYSLCGYIYSILPISTIYSLCEQTYCAYICAQWKCTLYNLHMWIYILEIPYIHDIFAVWIYSE